ncbi:MULTISPECIES: MaoC family dehydratase [Micromonospora]|uniref:Dehydratase n=1 Tax=Micromonospora chalcea TaxID=1874 RepID=A0ABX9Y7R6_MICCH|nr:MULTISPECIES: MaoC family dehydratase [Micromonospora]MBC8989251.1 MaoC family dehydratase [Micromonospora chalcea]MBP1785720.1 acyl dehydratase [Micromonospora sp. HB375]MBQ1060518.1 MaoC family dehydratase [Micromonospora sp. C41]MBQ1066400.1 MaoC family dehydratase [Micromonospora sp. D75]MCK1807321.1 MaoC family dehydratase [Micromonospora sp. R42106]
MELPTQTYRVTRADLVRYAGASGDFNRIHWSDRVATDVGLPGVIAHGMFTMALVGRAVTGWAGAPDAVVDFGVRFTRPVVVPDTDEGTEIEVSAVVKEVTEDGLTRLDITATCQGEKVLSQARALIRTTR